MKTDRVVLLVASTAIISLIIGTRLPRLYRTESTLQKVDYDSGPLCGACNNSGIVIGSQRPCTCPMGTVVWKEMNIKAQEWNHD